MDDQTPHVKKQFHSYGNAVDGDQHECNTVGMTWPRVDQRMFTENFKLAQKEQFDIIEGDDVELRWIKGIPGSLFQAKDLLDAEPEREWEGGFHGGQVRVCEMP